jgi:hypothetical protein
LLIPVRFCNGSSDVIFAENETPVYIGTFSATVIGVNGSAASFAVTDAPGAYISRSDFERTKAAELSARKDVIKRSSLGRAVGRYRASK